MQKTQSYHDKFWAIVTVFGALWGGLEITLGTFLHTLHVPKTGLVMVTLSVILLIAQRRIFPARGLTICTGVVAACIKSLSPGGIILGPMFGILMEAAVLELFLLAGSRNYLSGIFAGAMAVLSAQLMSVLRKWVIYGDDFIRALYRFVDRFLSLDSTPSAGWMLLAGVVGIILAIGGFTGFVGLRLGVRVEARLDRIESGIDNEQDAIVCRMEVSQPDPQAAAERGQGVTGTQGVSSSFCRGNRTGADEQILRTRRYLFPFAMLTLGMQIYAGLFAREDLMWTVPALALWMCALWLGARNVIKSMWWPKFWSVTFAVSILCGIILAYDFEGGWNIRLGVEAAARMVLRGMFVFSWLGWLTRCLSMQEFHGIWTKIGMPGLGHALTRAYVLLPVWLDRMNDWVKNRPEGLINSCKYIHACVLVCLVEAVRQTDDTETFDFSGAQTRNPIKR